jgi:hypothetical protein
MAYVRRLLALYPGDGPSLWFYAMLVDDDADRERFRQDLTLAMARLHPYARPLDFQLAAEQVLHRVDHARRTRGHPVDAVAGMVPGDHPGRRARRVVAVVDMRGDGRILFHRLAQQLRLPGVEKAARQDVAVTLEIGALRRGEDAGHAMNLPFGPAAHAGRFVPADCASMRA